MQAYDAIILIEIIELGGLVCHWLILYGKTLDFISPECQVFRLDSAAIVRTLHEVLLPRFLVLLLHSSRRMSLTVLPSRCVLVVARDHIAKVSSAFLSLPFGRKLLPVVLLLC